MVLIYHRSCRFLFLVLEYHLCSRIFYIVLPIRLSIYLVEKIWLVYDIHLTPEFIGCKDRPKLLLGYNIKWEDF